MFKKGDTSMSKEMYNEVRKTLRIAKELCYPKEIAYALRCARNVNELSRIMMNARHSK